MSKTIYLIAILSFFTTGCVTTTVLSFTDERPELLHYYKSAWLGEDELIVSYQTDQGERWSTIDLSGQQTGTFTGELPIEEQSAKRNIPIVVNERQSDFHYHRSRYNRSNEETNQLGKLFIIGDLHGIRDPSENIYLLVEPIGNVYHPQGKEIHTLRIPTYRPLWTYPARAVGVPIALCIDIVTIPLFFVSHARVAIKF